MLIGTFYRQAFSGPQCLVGKNVTQLAALCAPLLAGARPCLAGGYALESDVNLKRKMVALQTYTIVGGTR